MNYRIKQQLNKKRGPILCWRTELAFHFDDFRVHREIRDYSERFRVNGSLKYRPTLPFNNHFPKFTIATVLIIIRKRIIRPVSSNRAHDVDFKQYKENLACKHQEGSV